MAKKKNIQKVIPKKSNFGFDPESSPYFTPIAFGFIFIGLVVLFREFIFSNDFLYSGDMLNAGIFFRSFFVDYVLEHGSMPMWNPYIFGGMPFVDAFHGDILYPLSSLKFFGSLFRMLSYNLILHIFLAGVFTYLCARQFKLSKIASLLSGISYMYAGYIISMVAPWHDGKIFVTALFPLAILFLDRGFERKPFLNFSLLGLIIGLIILTPHPQMAYFSLWAISLYSLYKLIVLFLEKRTIKALIKPAALTTYAVVIGLLLSAIQFYPGYYYTSNYSPRTDSKQGWEWATSWSLHEEEAFSLLIPEFAGVDTQNAKTYYWGKNVFKDNSETVGIVCIFMGLIGLFFSRRRESYFFGGLAAFALIYGLGATTPVFWLFFKFVPMVKSLRAPSMIMFLFSFSIAMLAGMAMQFILDKSRDLKEATAKKFEYLLFGMPALMGLLALSFSASGKSMLNLWSSIFYSEASTTMVQEGVSKLDVAYANLPAIQSGAWIGFLFTALAAICIYTYRSKKAGPIILIGMLLIPIINGVRFNNRFINVTDPTPYLSSNALSDFFKSDTTKYRVQNLSRHTATNLPYHGIEVITGYHGNQLKWYDKLLGGPSLANQANPRFLNLAGAKYVIIPPNQRFPDNYFGDKPVTPAFNFSQGTVFKNDNAFPRVFFVERYQVLDSLDEIYKQVISGTEDLSKIVYLEEDPAISLTPDSASTDSAWVIDYQIESVLVGLNSTKNNLLVLTDNYYEAWNVYIDNQPAKILRADGSFRAVAIPAGAKEVHFKYESERYATGSLLTYSTSVYLLFVFGFYFVSSRRKEKVMIEDSDSTEDS